MPSFGSTSRGRLVTCHETHLGFWPLIVEKYDCSILCGARFKEEQNRAFAEDLSGVPWPKSKHNVRPEDAVRDTSEWHLPLVSRAIDVAPWPIDWDDIERFYHFAGYVKHAAETWGLPLRWGGDWNGNNDLRDQKFFDLVHWELW